jgi:ribosome-binding factor A
MSIKQQRMADQLRALLSSLLLTEVRDPRLKHVTVTRVMVDREYQSADIYVNALGDENRRDEVLAGLEHSKGFLRREIAARVRLRQTPELHFHWDLNLEHGERMNRLLDDLDIPEAEEEPEEKDILDFSLEDLLDDDQLD